MYEVPKNKLPITYVTRQYYIYYLVFRQFLDTPVLRTFFWTEICPTFWISDGLGQFFSETGITSTLITFFTLTFKINTQLH